VLRHLGLQARAHVGQGLAQQSALARRQAQCARALRCVEVVQVAQVGRHGAPRGLGQHGLVQQRGAAAAHVAQHEEVV